MSEHHLRLEAEQAGGPKRGRAAPEKRSGKRADVHSVRTSLPSGVAREVALFTAVEGRVVEEGAGGAAPLGALVILLLGSRLHRAAPNICDGSQKTRFRRGHGACTHTHTHRRQKDSGGVSLYLLFVEDRFLS